MTTSEPDVVLNLRALEATVVEPEDGDPFLRLTDGVTVVDLKPCAGGASPEAMNGLDSMIHEGGELWNHMRRALRRGFDEVGEQG